MAQTQVPQKVRVILAMVSLMIVSPSVFAETLDPTDCHHNCFERKKACHEGVEDVFAGVSGCQSELTACKLSCKAPERGYKHVQGLQLAFKFTPLIPGPQALFMTKKNDEDS